MEAAVDVYECKPTPIPNLWELAVLQQVGTGKEGSGSYGYQADSRVQLLAKWLFTPSPKNATPDASCYPVGAARWHCDSSSYNYNYMLINDSSRTRYGVC
jgi:hypothetical protein